MKLGLNVSLGSERERWRARAREREGGGVPKFGSFTLPPVFVGVCLSLALSSRAVNLSVTANLHCVNLKYSINSFAYFI